MNFNELIYFFVFPSFPSEQMNFDMIVIIILDPHS